MYGGKYESKHFIHVGFWKNTQRGHQVHSRTKKETTQNILNTIGLDWDDGCLSFHNTERVVQTASEWQVRQPIYKTSVETQLMSWSELNNTTKNV